MNLRYTVLDPAGNKTLIVETPVERDKYKTVADILMQKEPDVEQVGFLEEADDGADIHLEMAGGEFCGNASMCAAAMFLEDHRLKEGVVRLSVSGADEILGITLKEEGRYWKCSAEMPVPESVWLRVLKLNGKDVTLPVVNFKGISHAIVSWNMEYEEAEKIIEDWAEQLDVDTLGIMLLDEENSKLLPLVFVKKSDTLFWEHSCASGTAAVGAWSAVDKNQDFSVELKQPGGSIGVSVEYSDEKMKSLVINGKVRISSTCSVELDI